MPRMFSRCSKLLKNIKYAYLFLYTPTMSTNGNPTPCSTGRSNVSPEITNPAQSSDGSSTVTESGKRDSYLSWEEYFMAVAFLSSKCSKDPKTQVGACIVNEDKKIVGIGYNTMPNGCEEMPWTYPATTNALDNKLLYVCYAAKHAVLNCNRTDLKNCSLYTSVFPSNECAKILIQAHLKEVIYFSDKFASKPFNTVAKRMFEKARITWRKYSSPRTKINIKFQNCVDLNEKGERDNGSEEKPRLQLEWSSDNFFMAMAFLTAQRSKDPKTQVGACIVNEDNQIVSVGYNSMPVGCVDSDMPWLVDLNDVVSSKHAYVCHAELNAVMNRNCASLKGCRIYVTLYPCNECTKILIQSGIKEIVYFNDKKENGTVPIPYQASARMFRAVSKGKERIIIRKHDPYREEPPLGEINFDDFDA